MASGRARLTNPLLTANTQEKRMRKLNVSPDSSIYATKYAASPIASRPIPPQRVILHQISACLSRTLTTHLGYRGEQSEETPFKAAELCRCRVECRRCSTSLVQECTKCSWLAERDVNETCDTQPHWFWAKRERRKETGKRASTEAVEAATQRLKYDYLTFRQK